MQSVFCHYVLTKLIYSYIIKIEKRQTSSGYANNVIILYNNRLARGGYCAFMVKIINIAIIIKTANSNFFAICNNMLTFHKHTPFHKLGIKPVNIKVGITAG